MSYRKIINQIVVGLALAVISINWNAQTWAADYEPNDTSDQAQTLTSGTYQISGNGNDWFAIEVNPGLLEFSMTPANGTDVNMVLYNGNFQIVAADFESGTESFTYQTSTSTTYYLEIYSTVSYSTTSYSLTISVPSSTWSKTLNFGPIRNASVSLYDIDSDGEDEIFVGTSKGLDSSYNEIRPAALVCLEANGDIKWSKSFPAISGADSQTGIIYQTTSVTTSPVFADINNDNSIDIIVGVGGDTQGEVGADVSGQPGDMGGVYALDANGEILWFHQSLDQIGGTLNTGDNRPDGVYGSPVVFDIDRDGKREVIYGGWDRQLWILDAETGIAKVQVNLADTIWATPKIADLNGDGQFEILVSADITENSDAGTSTGGIFHVVSANGTQNISGFDQPVGNPSYTMLRGKYEEQALWSSPVTADLDGDGMLEIVYGTGNYFHDSRGSYIRVWEHNGESKFLLTTIGRTFATPLVADIDNDGNMEIVAATLEGYLYGWDNTGSQIFATQTRTIPAVTGNPIFGAPIAVDLDDDGKLEIIVSQGAQLVIVDSEGTQITQSDSTEYIFEMFKGAAAAKDIDGDYKIDLISGGNTSSKDQAVVSRWTAPDDVTLSALSYGRYQFHQSLTNISDFVSRFYQVVLGRSADALGLNYWTDSLYSGTRAGADVAVGFIFSEEFTNQQLDNESYLQVLYSAFFNREPDQSGYNSWLIQLDSGTGRDTVLDGFIYSQEFKNLCLAYSILAVK
ncbi:MAG: DUF4214 domain-containing protein [Desulfobulbaceae bacterium]|nr:DUF4214 domain-containing protein [Desulfobulbaceae bacterium]